MASGKLVLLIIAVFAADLIFFEGALAIKPTMRMLDSIVSNAGEDSTTAGGESSNLFDECRSAFQEFDFSCNDRFSFLKKFFD